MHFYFIAMSHSRIFSQQVRIFPLSKMFSRVYYAQKTSVRKKMPGCEIVVDIMYFLLHRLAFSFVRQSR